MPSLTKGQTAPHIAQRSETICISVVARIELVERCIRNPEECSGILQSFKSFDTFAAWHAPERGILRISPKTLRNHVNWLFAEGHEAFVLRLKTIRVRNAPVKEAASVVRGRLSVARTESVLAVTLKYLDLRKRIFRLSRFHPTAHKKLAAHCASHPDVPHSSPIGNARLRLVGKGGAFETQQPGQDDAHGAGRSIALTELSLRYRDALNLLSELAASLTDARQELANHQRLHGTDV